MACHVHVLCACRAANPLAEPVSRPRPPAGAAPMGGMLMGAELQAAINAKRGQLKKVAESHPPVSSAGAGAGVGQEGGVGLHDVLRRGLQRFQFDGEGGDTEFIEAAMAKTAPQ